MRGFTYPAHYPENCPPEPYTELPDYYHRMVLKSDGIRSKDFKSYYERNKRVDSDKVNGCKQRSVSLFKNKEEAINILYQFPGMPYRFIARIYLPGGHGVIHHTPNENGKSHHDWWVPKEVDPTSFKFEITGPYNR